MTLYTVPTGFFAIVRCIDMLPQTSGATTTAFLHHTAPGYLGAWAFSSTVIYNAWRGRQVMNAGESLIAQAGAVGVWFLASGYVFPV